MSYKFENLEVWKLSLDYTDLIYAIAEKLPRIEEHNLKSQIIRAATSISLNIAEGSTTQSNPEQSRFIKMAIRSLIETVACQHLTYRRDYFQKNDPILEETYQKGEILFKKLQAFRKALTAIKPLTANS